jgi:hypothetical protein
MRIISDSDSQHWLEGTVSSLPSAVWGDSWNLSLTADRRAMRLGRPRFRTLRSSGCSVAGGVSGTETGAAAAGDGEAPTDMGVAGPRGLCWNGAAGVAGDGGGGVAGRGGGEVSRGREVVSGAGLVLAAPVSWTRRKCRSSATSLVNFMLHSDAAEKM